MTTLISNIEKCPTVAVAAWKLYHMSLTLNQLEKLCLEEIDINHQRTHEQFEERLHRRGVKEDAYQCFVTGCGVVQGTQKARLSVKINLFMTVSAINSSSFFQTCCGRIIRIVNYKYFQNC